MFQLQQINFMSLMQVVGASFANLPLSQANPQLAQLHIPASQATAPAQPQVRASLATVAQSADGLNNVNTQTPQNIRRQNAEKPISALDLQNRRSRAAGQQPSSLEAEPCEEITSAINSRLNTQVKRKTLTSQLFKLAIC